MKPGDVYSDRAFQFHDGETGHKLIVILGSEKGVTLICKTTSQPYGKSIHYGCQPDDRIPNFYLPLNSCYLKKPTWICLNEFYELKASELLNKKFSGTINHIFCLTDPITRELQDCAMNSDDITPRQEQIIAACRSNAN